MIQTRNVTSNNNSQNSYRTLISLTILNCVKEKCRGYQKFNAKIMIENKFSILRYMHEIYL